MFISPVKQECQSRTETVVSGKYGSKSVARSSCLHDRASHYREDDGKIGACLCVGCECKRFVSPPR